MYLNLLDNLFIILVVLLSAAVHEAMHAFAAYKLGDNTAKYQGRLTLNPLKHIDMFGSIILPLLMVFSNSPIFFGWAKPVPYNPYNLGAGKWGEAIVAGAGPLSNLFLAAIFSLLVRSGAFAPVVSDIFVVVVLINVTLFIFNLVPIPPLDGSKVIEALLPRGLQYRYGAWRRSMESNPFLGFGAVILFLYLFGSVLSIGTHFVAGLLLG